MARPEDKTVLVVDDEPDIVMYLRTALEDAGFNVVTASDGQDALEIVGKSIPDFISLDLVMPRKSGIKFFHELRRKREWVRIPVMVVTGHARDEKGSKDLNEILSEKTMSGPGLYLEKPVKAAEFVRAVADALDVELPEASVPGVDPDDLRRQARQAVDRASPEELAAALEILRRQKG
ncbi:MAG: response regulator [Deltaproteobacteria bacterium]|nr:response regulator [Deltaproteobacteria bacterium]